MAVTNILSTLRRRAPSVIECFRNAQFYQRDNAASSQPLSEMVVLFTWLGAKQKYAHKYAQCWTRRGYDVLHVTTTVRDLLFPRNGSEVTASRVVDFLDKRDNSVIVHGLSVGGYLTQRVLLAARDSTVRISHQIFDSMTNCVGMEAGVQNAVHPRFRSLAKAGVRLYSMCADLSSIREAENCALNCPYPSPATFIHSMADKVAVFPDTEPLIIAHQKVAPVTTYLIPEELQVPHVSIMRYLGEDKYISLIQSDIEKHRGLSSMGVEEFSPPDVMSIPANSFPSSERIIVSL